LCEGLAEAVDLGLIKSVGVSNFEAAELTYFHNALVRLKNTMPKPMTATMHLAGSSERSVSRACDCLRQSSSC
jgi:diketogulonate reductase-like aldo/keto reductase